MWEGNIGIINATDYVKASTDSNCVNIYSAFQEPYFCKNNNYLFNEKVSDTLSMINWAMEMGGPCYVWYIRADGQLSDGRNTGSFVSMEHETFPVIYIRSDIVMKGSGKVDDPYIFEV